jgi:hypothetical protein
LEARGRAMSDDAPLTIESDGGVLMHGGRTVRIQ